MGFQQAFQWWFDLRNRADFALRRRIAWNRPGLRIENEPKTKLLLDPEVDRLAAALVQTYHLAPFRDASRADNYLENLYYLDLLEKALKASGGELPGEIEAADIGVSSWFYVQALHSVLTWWRCPEQRKVSLRGYEADPYRVYADLYSRYDHARAHMRGLSGVSYVPVPFITQPDAFDLVTMLFPFVFVDDALRWGLPGRMFEPADLLAAAIESLKPGGILIIVNQGKAEHDRQREMLTAAGLPIAAAYRHEPCFYSYPIDRYVLVSRREQ
jgi:SAM-dependent methyltransferase